ncbi:MAG: hypothetical protein WCS43_11845 [Verrucomicrobiota bacterium]
MSIFDDIPLPIGTEYYHRTIIDWSSEMQKYLVRYHECGGMGELVEKWLPRTVVERHHAAFVCEGLDLTTIHRASPRNTRFFRRNPD